MTLTSRHVQLALDYEKFGVRESGVLLDLVRPPQYGRLFSTLWRRADEATFTLLDVHSDRVRSILNLIPFFKKINSPSFDWLNKSRDNESANHLICMLKFVILIIKLLRQVRYVHDGSETARDSALLELELAPRAGFLLPAYLQKRQRFVLQVTTQFFKKIQ